jgi:D-3-phosphoglycerate dehydrogenase
MSFRVIVTDYAWPSLDIERDILDVVGAQIIAAPPDPDGYARLVASSDAILTNWRLNPAPALKQASKCLVISRYGIGVDNIPTQLATELGIAITNVPDFCLDEVSDHVIAMLLTCARRVVPLTSAVSSGQWGLESARGMRRLKGKTLGLVGFGNTARSVVPKALALGLDVQAWTPRLKAIDVPNRVRVSESLEALLQSSDFVSLHAPANESTHCLIDRIALQRMKTSAYLLNVSRGTLVDEPALAEAVKTGRIAGAALDVLTTEPPMDGHPLVGLDAVLLTPHAAFYSEEAIEEVRRRAAQHVCAVLTGIVPPSVVNGDVLRSPELRFKLTQDGGRSSS